MANFFCGSFSNDFDLRIIICSENLKIARSWSALVVGMPYIAQTAMCTLYGWVFLHRKIFMMDILAICTHGFYIIHQKSSQKSQESSKLPYHTKLSQGPFKWGLTKIDLSRSFFGRKCILGETNYKSSSSKNQLLLSA